MTITNQPAYEAATAAILSARHAKLGVRKQAMTSRDMAKPANTAAVFISGGPYEIHASRTAGRMKDRVWCYFRGALVHEATDAVTCKRIVDLADALRA